jgi:hypothetical protein
VRLRRPAPDVCPLTGDSCTHEMMPQGCQLFVAAQVRELNRQVQRLEQGYGLSLAAAHRPACLVDKHQLAMHETLSELRRK